MNPIEKTILAAQQLMAMPYSLAGQAVGASVKAATAALPVARAAAKSYAEQRSLYMQGLTLQFGMTGFIGPQHAAISARAFYEGVVAALK